MGVCHVGVCGGCVGLDNGKDYFYTAIDATGKFALTLNYKRQNSKNMKDFYELRKGECRKSPYLIQILDKISKLLLFYFMLRLSTKGQYGVRAMYEIAKGYPEPIPIRLVAEAQSLSISYLEQILNKLKHRGLLIAIKGPGGGYVLSRRPEEINIIDILRELEGPVALTSCLNPEEGCVRVEGCVTHLLWKRLGEEIEAFLRTISLKDLLEYQKLKNGIRAEVKQGRHVKA